MNASEYSVNSIDQNLSIRFNSFCLRKKKNKKRFSNLRWKCHQLIWMIIIIQFQPIVCRKTIDLINTCYLQPTKITARNTQSRIVIIQIIRIKEKTNGDQQKKTNNGGRFRWLMMKTIKWSVERLINIKNNLNTNHPWLDHR